MKEKPILFNTEMVRAILEGRKTVTRRVIKPQPKSLLCYAFAGSRGMAGTWGYPGDDAWKSWGEEYKLPKDLSEADKNQRFTPPCHTDDILYVRETFAQPAEHIFWYKATPPKGCEGILWKPSIHMPKEAARIFLKVTDVRVEKLQDITSAEIKAEGTNLDEWYDYDEYQHQVGDGLAMEGIPVTFETLKGFFGETVWSSTLKNLEEYNKYGWDANPWVWVISFERVENRRRNDD